MTKAAPHRHASDARFFFRGAELAMKEAQRLAPTAEAEHKAGQLRGAAARLKSLAAELEVSLRDRA